METSNKKSYLRASVLAAVLLAASVSMSGCGPALRTLKAGPAPDHGFLPSAELLTDGTGVSPFQRMWNNFDEAQRMRYTELYIAPVDVSSIRDGDWWTGLNTGGRDIRRDAENLARETRLAFEERVRMDKAGTFRLVEEAQLGPRTAVLQIAIVELVPGRVLHALAGTAAGFAVPGGGLLALGSSGSIAIEAKLLSGTTGEPLQMFADRERGKFAPVNLRDFTLYGAAREIVDDWADQWLKMCSTPINTRIADSSPIRLLPW